jgi:hypothetical protein
LPAHSAPAPTKASSIFCIRPKVKRTTRIQNTLRTLFDQQGIRILDGHGAWTAADIKTLSYYRECLAQGKVLEVDP